MGCRGECESASVWGAGENVRVPVCVGGGGGGGVVHVGWGWPRGGRTRFPNYVDVM